jgi:arylsulfatase A-like enzyme
MYKPETDFLIYDNERKVEKIKKDENLLNEYIKLYPHRTISDLNYPLERSSSEIPDVLSPFFFLFEKPPNIVIIIVESLGSYLMGKKGENVSFTPFLDSLANTGLYWKNCLATTPRTFGVLPALLASVPHGMRGFQFGVMPNHHSLFSILKNNNYSTSFFYGSDPNFDSMQDFLTIQETDHIDNFLPQMSEFKKKNLASWWGLNDHVLFNESFKHLKTISTQKPKVSLYLTITTHDPLPDNDKVLKTKYENKTEKLLSKLDPKQKNYFSPVKKHLASFVYIDDCIRDLIHHYSKQSDFENTIFIITGDHSVSLFKNRLAHFSVPLIIWSPLLKKHQTFPNIVSHLAITPSILSLLHHNYNVKLPDHLSWLSDGLDTASVFNPKEKVLLLNYERRINEMVYNQYFFDNSDYKLYEIDENLDFTPVQDAKLIESISSKFNTLKYINNYVYHNDKIIKYTDPSSKYKIIKKYENPDPIVCKTPDTIPSISGIKTFHIMPVQTISGKHDKIKIQFSADLVINDYIYQDAQMMLNFICLGENFKYVSSELITKYIVDENVLSNTKHELLIEKEVDVSATDNISVNITVSSNEWDENWEPDKKITISNIRVLLGVNKE